MKLKPAIVAAIACLVLVVPGTALAASPTEDAYSGVLPAASNGDNGSNGNGPSAGTESAGTEAANGTEAVSVSEAPVSEAAVASVGSDSTLPFTGLEVGIIALAGVVLIGGGVVLYRFSRSTAPRNS